MSQLLEVLVRVDVEGVDPSEVAVEFTTPTGQVFDRQVKQLTQPRTEKQSVEFGLPVAGTFITSNQLVGTWQARVFLAGVEL